MLRMEGLTRNSWDRDDSSAASLSWRSVRELCKQWMSGPNESRSMNSLGLTPPIHYTDTVDWDRMVLHSVLWEAVKLRIRSSKRPKCIPISKGDEHVKERC